MLFYSKFCEHSKMLITLINNTELGDEMQMVCVDKRNPLQMQYIKKYKITEVPTLIYSDKKYTGDQAFQLVEKIASSSMSNNSKSQGQQESQGGKEGDLSKIGHYNAEFNGFSDNFSTFGEEKPDPLERSFSFLGGKGSSNMVPEGKVKETNKKDVANDYERLIQQRSEISPGKPVG
jgi:hypothetical protein